MEHKRKEEMPDEDYGDYVTRCICDLAHDDGYMIACDDCGVWQHIECMQVDPKNLPDNYLCEQCEPRAVDRRRARQIQIKKRDALSELDSRGSGGASLLTTTPLSGRKKRKKARIPETPRGPSSEAPKRPKKDTPPAQGSSKKPKKRRSSKPQPRSRLNSSSGSIQSLLTAASLLEGEGSGVWSSTRSPWCDDYQTTDHSSLSVGAERAISHRLSMLKSEAVVYTRTEHQHVRCSDGQCSVAEVARQRKGLVADVIIPEDELVIEYKGVVSLKSDLLSEVGTRLLWKQAPCPYVYQYDKMGDFQLCIDTRNHGNQARFIRRSCCPNAEVRHFFVEDSLMFGVYALTELAQHEEITLAFDFPPDKCEYPVECACGQGAAECRISARMSKPHPQEEEAGSGRGRLHLLDEDSNSSWASTGSGKRRRSHKTTPLSPKSAIPTSRDSSSDSDGEKRRKSLTREERKTEQVWKMFEKMEANKKKRAPLVSEGSADSADPITSPLHTRHMIRDKRTQSRKAQLLASSANKMRLSSVSSSDPLSPTDMPEPFSPPTPQAPPTGPVHHSPSVEPSPSLHPKYLLEDFVLPLKKALLRKWEAESGGAGVVTDYWYWANSAHCDWCWPEESTPPPVRGSLKHRWLRQLMEEGVVDILDSPPLPHKKLFLQRWLDSTSYTHSRSHDSPLFSDWSDGEDFDDFGKRRHRDSSLTEHEQSPPVDQSDSLQESRDSVCSDISEVSMALGPKTPPLREASVSPAHSPGPVDVSDISSDSNLLETHPQEEPLESDHMTVVPDHVTSQPLSPKTPIKRKINLSEYRNRARKPPDRKSSAETTPQPAPQFEPVSPDERDNTPPLAEGSPPMSCASHVIPGAHPPPGGILSGFQPRPPTVWTGLPAEAHDPRIGHMIHPGVFHETRPALHPGFIAPRMGRGYHMTGGTHPHTSSAYSPPRPPPGHYYQ